MAIGAHMFGALLLGFHANVKRLFALELFQQRPLLFTLAQVLPELGAVGCQLLFFASVHVDLACLDRELEALELTRGYNDLLGQGGGMEAAVGGERGAGGLRRR